MVNDHLQTNLVDRLQDLIKQKSNPNSSHDSSQRNHSIEKEQPQSHGKVVKMPTLASHKRVRSQNQSVLEMIQRKKSSGMPTQEMQDMKYNLDLSEIKTIDKTISKRSISKDKDDSLSRSRSKICNSKLHIDCRCCQGKKRMLTTALAFTIKQRKMQEQKKANLENMSIQGQSCQNFFPRNSSKQKYSTIQSPMTNQQNL